MNVPVLAVPCPIPKDLRRAIPAVTETTKAIRTAGPAGMQAAAAAQEATPTSSSMEVTFPWVTAVRDASGW